MYIGKREIGQVVAPLPFLILGLVAVTASAILCPWIGLGRGIMAAFDVGTVAFVAASTPLFAYAAIQMRKAVLRNDANRGSLLLISTVVMGVILVAVAANCHKKEGHGIST